MDRLAPWRVQGGPTTLSTIPSPLSPGCSLVTGSPCAGTKLPKAAPHRVEPLTTEQVEALAGSVPARYRAAVLLAAGTGIRQGKASASLP